MIIKDLKGTRYSLSSKRLSELPLKKASRYVLAEDIIARSISTTITDDGDDLGFGEVLVKYRESIGSGMLLPNHSATSIGCRPFSPANYAKILKAAGVKKARKKKAAKK